MVHILSETNTILLRMLNINTVIRMFIERMTMSQLSPVHRKAILRTLSALKYLYSVHYHCEFKRQILICYLEFLKML